MTLPIFTTSLPCPPWCDGPTGHGFHSADREGVARDHERQIAVLSLPHPELPDQPRRVCVDLTAMEVAASEEGPVIRTTAVEIMVMDFNGDGLTGPQSRQLAAALLNAADEWDRITS